MAHSKTNPKIADETSHEPPQPSHEPQDDTDKNPDQSAPSAGAGSTADASSGAPQAAKISVTVTPPKRTKSESARLRAAEVKARKLDAIATRRATAAKMGKAEFIAEIVKGNYRPITAEEIAAEPTPA